MDLTQQELAFLRRVLVDWVNEGFTDPPDEYYSVAEKLGGIEHFALSD